MAGFDPGQTRDKLGQWARGAVSGAIRTAKRLDAKIPQAVKAHYRAKSRVAEGAVRIAGKAAGATLMLGAIGGSPVGSYLIYNKGFQAGLKRATGSGQTQKPGSLTGSAVPTKPPHIAKPGKVNHVNVRIGKASGDKETTKGALKTSYRQPSHTNHARRK